TVYALESSNGLQLWNYTTISLRAPANAVSSSPAVVSGVVYVGSWDDDVYALNATNGEKLWNYKTGNQVESSPAVVNGVVYIGSDDGNVYALGSSPASSDNL